MLIAILAAFTAAAPAQPPSEIQPPAHTATARDLVRMQLEHGSKPLPPQTGAEATVIGNAYLKSIGHPVQPVADTASQTDGSAGGSTGGYGSR